MQADVIQVGMTAALTGRYSLPGRQALLGAYTWVEETNRGGGIWLHTANVRLPLRLTWYDDASDPEQCRLLTERLLRQDRVDILLGPYSSGLALRAAEVANRWQHVLWNHGGASEAIYRGGLTWVVGILSPPSTYFHSVIDYARQTLPTVGDVAVVHSTAGAFPRDIAAGAVQHCQQHGMATQRYPYPAGTRDFTPLLHTLAHARPTVVLSVGRMDDDLRFATQWLHHTMSAALVGLIVTPMTLFWDTLGPAAAQFVGPSQWEPGVVRQPTYGPTATQVLAQLRVRHPAGVDYPMAQAYAGGLIAQRCVEMAGTLAQAALRQAAHRLECTTFYGHFRMDALTGRQLGHRMPVVQWQHGQKVIVSGASQA